MYLWQLGNRERQKAYLFPLAGVSVSFSFLATVVTIAIRACGQLSPLWRTLTILKSTRNFRSTLEQKILKFEQHLYYVDPITLLRAWSFNPFLVIPPTVGSLAWQSVWAGEGMSSLSRTMLFWCYCDSTLSQITGACLGTNVKVCFLLQSIKPVTLPVFVAALRIRIYSQETTCNYHNSLPFKTPPSIHSITYPLLETLKWFKLIAWLCMFLLFPRTYFCVLYNHLWWKCWVESRLNLSHSQRLSLSIPIKVEMIKKNNNRVVDDGKAFLSFPFPSSPALFFTLWTTTILLAPVVQKLDSAI